MTRRIFSDREFPMNDAKGTKGILALVAVLLAANLAATLLRPGVDQPAVAALSEARAGEVLRIEGPYLVTTNAQGDSLTLWKLGRIVNDRYESVTSQTFKASGAN